MSTYLAIELGYALQMYATNFRNQTMKDVLSIIVDNLQFNGTTEDVARIIGATNEQIKPLFATVSELPTKLVVLEVQTQIATLPVAEPEYTSKYNGGLMVLAAATVLSTVLRVVSRYVTQSRIRPEDWFIIAALVSMIECLGFLL